MKIIEKSIQININPIGSLLAFWIAIQSLLPPVTKSLGQDLMAKGCGKASAAERDFMAKQAIASAEVCTVLAEQYSLKIVEISLKIIISKRKKKGFSTLSFGNASDLILREY